MKRNNKKQPKLSIKKGDMVAVIAGDDKGSQGKVLSVSIKDNRAIVEGVAMVSKHTKPNAENANGGIIKQEASINISNLMLIDPSTGNPTKVGRRVNAEGKLERFAKKSGEVIK